MGTRILRKVGLGIGLLLMTAACILAGLRWAGPNAAQRQALQTLDQSAPTGSHNAFGPLWVLGRQVPAAEVERVLAADAASLDTDATRFRSAAEDHPAWPVPPAAQRCGSGDASCLQKVRAQVADPAAWLQHHEGLRQQLESLTQADHYRHTLPHRLHAPMPPLTLLALLPTFRAVQFAHGKHGAALEATCRDIQMWRRLGAHSDSLLVTVFAARTVGTSARLLADMASEAPPGQPWPAACDAALAPDQPAEVSLCGAMHGEMGYARDALLTPPAGAAPSPWYQRALEPLVMDARRTLGALAESRARFCEGGLITATLQDREVALPPLEHPGFVSRTCLGNTAGCILLGVSEPVFTDSLLNLQDAAAQLQLLRTWRWLRTQPVPADAQALAATLARVPDDVGLPKRTLSLAEDGRALAMPLKRKGADPAGSCLCTPRPDDPPSTGPVLRSGAVPRRQPCALHPPA